MDPTRRKATEADLWAIPEDERFHELIDGELIRKAAPSGAHGGTQGDVVGFVRGPFQRRAGGPDGPGGWWFGTLFGDDPPER